MHSSIISFLSLLTLSLGLANASALPKVEERSTCVQATMLVHGRQCTTYCGRDRPGPYFKKVQATSLADCEVLCAENTQCLNAGYQIATKSCYMKDILPHFINEASMDVVDCAVAATTTTKKTTTSLTTTTSSTTTTGAAPTSTLIQVSISGDPSTYYAYPSGIAVRYTDTIADAESYTFGDPSGELEDGNEDYYGVYPSSVQAQGSYHPLLVGAGGFPTTWSVVEGGGVVFSYEEEGDVTFYKDVEDVINAAGSQAVADSDYTSVTLTAVLVSNNVLVT